MIDYDWYPYNQREVKQRNREQRKHKKLAYKGGGRDWSETAVARNTCSNQKLEEARKEPCLEGLEAPWPCQCLGFRLPALKTVRE
jgi:hypothetical protein